MEPGQWQDPERRRLALRRAAALDQNGIEASLLLLNGAEDDCAFKLPGPALHWVLALDSSDPEKTPSPLDGSEIPVPARAVVLLIGQPNTR